MTAQGTAGCPLLGRVHLQGNVSNFVLVDISPVVSDLSDGVLRAMVDGFWRCDGQAMPGLLALVAGVRGGPKVLGDHVSGLLPARLVEVDVDPMEGARWLLASRYRVAVQCVVARCRPEADRVSVLLACAALAAPFEEVGAHEFLSARVAGLVEDASEVLREGKPAEDRVLVVEIAFGDGYRQRRVGVVDAARYARAAMGPREAVAHHGARRRALGRGNSDAVRAMDDAVAVLGGLHRSGA